MPRLCLAVLLALLGSSAVAHAQHETDTYSRRNTLAFAVEYADNSNRLLLGGAQNRRLLTLGAGYSHRILLRRTVALDYLLEFRPVVLESDPVTHTAFTYTGPPRNSSYTYDDRPYTHCTPGSVTSTGTYSGGPNQGSTYTTTQTSTCGLRQWTIGQGLSPVGLRLNLLPRRRLQPVLTLLGGELYTTRPIPITNAGSFNYTLEVGAGVELYRSATHSPSLFGNRSLRVELRFHHISNADTAPANPGIDSAVIHLSYAFGR